MDSMSGCDIRLVFTLPPRDSTLQYKRCVHLWNNFPYITPLYLFIYLLFIYGKKSFCFSELKVLDLEELYLFISVSNLPVSLLSVITEFRDSECLCTMHINILYIVYCTLCMNTVHCTCMRYKLYTLQLTQYTYFKVLSISVHRTIHCTLF